MCSATIELMYYLARRGTQHEIHWEGWLEAYKRACITLTDRIYIAEEIGKAGVQKQFLEFGENIRESGDVEGEHVDRVNVLIDKVAEMARRH
jgi:hypothetical protein